MEMKIPAIAITAVVVITVLAGVLMPVLDDAMEQERTFTNNGIVRMQKITSADSLNATWSYSDPYALTVNGDRVDLPQSVSIALTVVGTTDVILRYTPNEGGGSTQMIGFVGTNTIQASTDNQRTVTISAENGQITISNGVASASSQFEYAFIVSSNGDYIMKNSNESAYLLSDSEIYGFGRTWLSASSVTVNFNVIGNIENMDVTSFGTTVATASNINVNYSDVNGFENLYEFSSVTFDATVTGTDSVTYNQVIVPLSVTAEKTMHFSDNESAIFAAIPIMVIVALLIAVVAMVFRSRQF